MSFAKNALVVVFGQVVSEGEAQIHMRGSCQFGASSGLFPARSFLWITDLQDSHGPRSIAVFTFNVADGSMVHFSFFLRHRLASLPCVVRRQASSVHRG